MLSARYSQDNGEPQRSVLSVTLFTIAINGMVNTIGPSVATSLYVDDVTIYYSSRSIVTIEHRLQGAINRLTRWALEKRFSFSADKTQCVHFTRLRGLHSQTSLFLRDSALLFVPTVKFLGIILDSKLSWEPHLRWLRIKFERSLNVLKVLSSRVGLGVETGW
jgi:hypothetical protein